MATSSYTRTAFHELTAEARSPQNDVARQFEDPLGHAALWLLGSLAYLPIAKPTFGNTGECQPLRSPDLFNIFRNTLIAFAIRTICEADLAAPQELFESSLPNLHCLAMFGQSEMLQQSPPR